MADILGALQPYFDFERTQWTNGPVEDDPFYQAPEYGPHDKPGALLKVEQSTDTTKYLLPAGVALSRIVYLSETIHGTPVPASAYVLWPYSPRQHRDGKHPVVAWAHGTSGLVGNSAPSHHSNVWQHFLAPYQIVLNGYVVVATDYIGLGVVKDRSGNAIIHPYLCSSSHANDVVFGVQAAREAFSSLSQDFVTIGHSQGGGTAWAVAQRQATNPIAGCLGCIPISPTTRFLSEPEPFLSIITAAVCAGVKATFPDADISAILTPIGEERTRLIREAQTGVAASIAMASGVDLVKPDFKENAHLIAYAEACAAGGKPIGCPILVMHGLEDSKISPIGSRSAAQLTGQMFPQASIAYVGLPGVTHDPALSAGQSIWLQWIADRFDGKPATTGLVETTLEAARPVESYHPEVNWYLAQATEPYQTP